MKHCTIYIYKLSIYSCIAFDNFIELPINLMLFVRSTQSCSINVSDLNRIMIRMVGPNETNSAASTFHFKTNKCKLPDSVSDEIDSKVSCCFRLLVLAIYVNIIVYFVY